MHSKLFYKILEKESSIKMKRLYYFYLIILWTGVLRVDTSAQDIQYFIANEKVVVEGGDSLLMADVYAKSDAGFKMGAGQLYINYDTSFLGQNIVGQNRLEVITDTTTLLGKKLNGTPLSLYGQFIKNDNSASRLSFHWSANFSADCWPENNMKFYIGKLFTLRIQMLPGSTPLSPALCFETMTSYIDQTYTACGPGTCDVQNCLDYPGINLSNDTYYCRDCRIITKTTDFGIGSFRMAIDCAGPGDTVYFDVAVNDQHIELQAPMIEALAPITVFADPQQNITITHKPAGNATPLLQARQAIHFYGTKLYGKHNGSFILTTQGQGAYEFLNLELQNVDVQTP